MRYATIPAVALTALMTASTGAAWAANDTDDEIIVGFATAKSGVLQAYDQPAERSAKIAIEEINQSGGLLGKQIQILDADTKSDRNEGVKAGQAVVDEGADIVVATCDYDYGAPAASVAQEEGLISFFLCAEDVKAGIEGIGPYAFSPSILAAVQGATMAEWGAKERGIKTGYVLVDTSIDYNKSVCYGFDWMFPKVGGEIIGRDTFRNDDPSIATQVTRIKNLPQPPDVIMLCSHNPGGAAAIKQIRAAGIDVPIYGGSTNDGNYWLDAVGGELSNFAVPVQGSIYGDDPNPKVEEFNKKFEAKYGVRPSSQYAYPGYVLIEVWAKAVERAGTTETEAVVAELEKMREEPTLVGPRTFTDELHHQNIGRYLIAEVTGGDWKIVDEWTISEPVPMEILFSGVQN
ncbi:ABC transporter substrate-binding protein [Marinibaculum pumilum]|uniref:ABC transporter substrate-binding protein n=1 Tax=Marinibaculum pumilum TaxID=1766165 RepID=A0ABV7L496_9PROT